MRLSFSLLACLFCAGMAVAETAILLPVADTTLSQNYPGNNSGGMDFVNSGTTQNNTLNRGLYRFDLSAIPFGARITSAHLVMEVVREPPEMEEPPSSSFALYRLLVPWGEGNKVSPFGAGRAEGAPAEINEANWTHRFAFTTNTWAVPGGGAGVDYLPDVSASRGVFGVSESPYEFGPTPALVADVQLWVDEPERNHGWMLISQSEEDRFTARSFGSREAVIGAPTLFVDYILPPQLEAVRLAAGEIQFRFLTQPETSYTVQIRSALDPATPWQTFTNLAGGLEATNVTLAIPLQGPARFIRVRVP